ncbi:MAG: WecB/TagA/CpsF family glycosyltransferase [Phycisphaerales bacterium]
MEHRAETSRGDVELMGVPVDAITLDGAAELVAARAAGGEGGWVVTPNLDILRRAVVDPEFRRLYDQTTLRLADGMPLVWAASLRGTPLPGRAAGSDLIFALAAHAARRGVPLHLVGGNPGTADKTAARLRELHPSLRVGGIECPPVGFERNEALVRSMIERLGTAGPGIVLVALGCPKQERLIEIMRPHMPGSWFIGIGITFSFVADEVRRAPRWMQSCGLEWVHRLVQEPRRLAKRYLVDGLPFAARLLGRSWLEGRRRAA